MLWNSRPVSYTHLDVYKRQGQDIAVMGAAFRKQLGYLPQDFGVYPNFTAEQFLLYIARLKGLSKFEAKRQTDGLLHICLLYTSRCV